MSERLGLVFLIDDDEADNYYHKMILERSGYVGEVIAFDRAERALDYLAKSRNKDNPVPDLILLDINMPAMNGWEFLEAYAKLDCFSESVVVVMLTTSLNPDDRARAESIEEIADFMIKPLNREGLEGLLEEHFAGGSNQPALS